jgi:hypothetical protein
MGILNVKSVGVNKKLIVRGHGYLIELSTSIENYLRLQAIFPVTRPSYLASLSMTVLGFIQQRLVEYYAC